MAGDALSGMSTLVAGGASGLGRAVALRFLAEGADVAAFDRDAEGLERLADDSAGRVVPIVGDVTDLEAQRRGCATVERVAGRLDALVFTVGVVDFVPGYLSYNHESFGAAFDEVMAINVRGPVSMSLVAHPMLRRSANASITFTLSTSAIHVPSSGPVYGLAKAALAQAVRQLAAELAPVVRVNGVVPGAIVDSAIRGPAALGQSDTPSPRLTAPDAGDRVAAANLVAFGPRGDDYAGLYVLLASPAGRVATGGVIPWDTGLGVLGHQPRER
jgi:2,3-dihydroxy-2,3-dihydrophenylpropionate dehydrogenase